MTTAQITPLNSKGGFSSPGFSVDNLGQLTATGLIVTGDAVIENFIFKVNGQPFNFLETEDSVISLSNDIRNSSLNSLGLLTHLEVENDVNLADVITIIDSVITINPAEGGTLDNVDIGKFNPKDGFFLSLQVGLDDSSGILSVKGNLDVSGSAQLTTLGVDTIVGDTVSITTQPTQASHATRKDYVDAKISAFAVAFGA